MDLPAPELIDRPVIGVYALAKSRPSRPGPVGLGRPESCGTWQVHSGGTVAIAFGEARLTRLRVVAGGLVAG